MEPKELMTKRRIEKLAKEYEQYGEVSQEISMGDRKTIDVFVSHSSADNEFIKKVLLFLKHAKGGGRDMLTGRIQRCNIRQMLILLNV